MDMELEHKTTILFSSQLHAHLTKEAKRRRMSLGELVRSACEKMYGTASSEQRLAAVDQLATLRLPVASPSTMKKQSVVDPEQILP